MEFTGSAAIEYGKKGLIEEWIHAFLQGPGGNIPLSDGLKLVKRYYLGPVLVPLHRLNRCCGPEEEMEYYNPKDAWDIRVTRLQTLIQKGWDMPPLIVQNRDSFLSVRDGNGRCEALNREGIESCLVVIWDESEEHLKQLKF